jgi:large subunit ribosomal protein L29
MKTLEEIRKTETDKLLEELKSLEKELFEKRFEVKNGQAKDSHSIKLLKLEIARIKTVLKENELNNK